MSIQAINWVLEEAPDVPPHLVSTLIAYANHADALGRNAYIGQQRLSWYTRKAYRNARKDVDALVKSGLMREGNQSAVAHLRADKRPTVYDLALERRRERVKLDEGMQTSPRLADGGTQGSPRHSSRGDAHVRSGGMPASPKPSTEPTSSSSSVRESVTARISAALGIEEEEAFKVFKKIKAERRPSAPSKYVDALIENGDLANFHEPMVSQLAYSGPWCDLVLARDGETCDICNLPAKHVRHGKAA